MACRCLQIILLVSLLLVYAQQATGLLPADKIAIDKGLEAGQAIADVFKNGEFPDVLKELSDNLGQFLGVFRPMLSLVFSITSSKKYTYFKKEFEKINNKLDILSADFKNLENLIDWNTVKKIYADYEIKIENAHENMNKIHSATPARVKGLKDDFLKSYNNDFDDSLQKLYNGAMKDHVLAGNLLQSVIKYTKNSKKKFEIFCQGLLQILTNGMSVKVAAFNLMNKTEADVTGLKKDWQLKIQKLIDRIKEKSDFIKSQYYSQLKIDAQDIILRHQGNNRELVKKLYLFVDDKYDWRTWFVAVYDNVRGFDKHAITLCGGHKLLHTKNGNIIIASQDNSRAWLASSKSQLQNAIEKNYPDVETRDMADQLLEEAISGLDKSCDVLAMGLVVKKGNNLYFMAPYNNYVFKSHKTTKTMCYSTSGGGACGTKTYRYSIILFA